MSLSIRRAQAVDAQALLDLRKASILGLCAKHYPHEDLVVFTAVEVNPAFLAILEGHFYLAERDGTIVGSGLINLADGQVDAIFAHPEAAGHGVGRAMMAHLEELARSSGLVGMKLEATLNAAAFYRRLGFVGDKQSVYVTRNGLALACVLMIKALV
jgi:GNAT superfamily N-acetyltransferase